MRFSQRKGLTEVVSVIQTEGMNTDLRVALWNILYEKMLAGFYYVNDSKFVISYWIDFKKRTRDTVPTDISGVVKGVIEIGEWYEVYDLIEFILAYRKSDTLNDLVNQVLEKELSGYRFVNGQITDITDKQEIKMLEEALDDEGFPHVRTHLQRALELLSDRKNPDYRNSIKESISAVESLAKEIAQKPNVELGEALKEIEKTGKIHGAMTKAFLSLYGYTSDANGIRHALMDEPNLTADDAKFFLLACTSFINYLKSKM